MRISLGISLFIVCLLFFAQVVSGQENIDKKILREEINNILSLYQSISSSVNNNSDEEQKETFLDLFRNESIFIYKDFSNVNNKDSIAVGDYLDEIIAEFPTGHKVILDVLDIGKPKPSDDTRYKIFVKLKKTISEIDTNLIQHEKYLTFVFEYYIENNKPDNMAIYDIYVSKIRDFSIGFHFSPLSTNIHNKGIVNDARFNSKRNIHISYGLEINYFFKSRLGIGTGIGINTYQNTLELNKFDALDGYDSNITDVKLNNTVQYIDVPLLIKFRTERADKTSIYINTGAIISFLSGSDLYSTGRDYNYSKVENVLSDNIWKQNLEEIVFSYSLSAGINVPIKRNIILNIGANYIQGLKSMDNYGRDSYIENKYTGSFNPLFAEPDSKTLNQSIGLEFGINYIF